MTEKQWLACNHPESMLTLLRGEMRVGRLPNGWRKLRLLACGYCRQIWELIEDERSRRLVEISEQWADGSADTTELAEAEVAAQSAKVVADINMATHLTESQIRRVAAAISTALHSANKEAFEAAQLASQSALRAVGGFWNMDILNPEWNAQSKQQAALLRDVFVNPFRPSPPLPVAVLAWNDGTVRRIAEGIYEERRMPKGSLDTARLAILADALLDAGCDNDDIIQHCREPGPHVRGCWAVDLILNKA